MVEIKIDRDKCDGCKICIDFCPVGILEIRGGKSTVMNSDECLFCGTCENECPNGAIKLIGIAPI